MWKNSLFSGKQIHLTHHIFITHCDTHCQSQLYPQTAHLVHHIHTIHHVHHPLSYQTYPQIMKQLIWSIIKLFTLCPMSGNSYHSRSTPKQSHSSPDPSYLSSPSCRLPAVKVNLPIISSPDPSDSSYPPILSPAVTANLPTNNPTAHLIHHIHPVHRVSHLLP